MADDIRDAKLVLRADDQATKTFVQVSKAIKDVTANLGAQAKAAKDDEGSLADLTGSLTDIQNIVKSINDQRGALKFFENSAASADEAAAKYDKAAKSLSDFKEKLTASGKAATPTQTTTLANKGAAVDRAQGNVDAANARLESARVKVEALGLSTSDTPAAFRQLQAEVDKVGPLFLETNAAINSFAENQKRAADVAVAATNEQIEAARTLDREASVAAAAQKQRTASLLAASTDVLSGNKTLEASFAELSRTDAFKKIGDDAVTASTNLARFAQTGQAANMSLSGLANNIRAIVTPTLADVQSLNGAVQQIDDSAEIASTKQKRRVSEYQDALNNLNQANAGLVRQAGNIEAFSRQSVALDILEAELGQTAERVEQLGRAVAQGGPNAERLAADLAKTRTELERVGTATQVARQAFVNQSEALKKAGVDVNDLAGSYGRIEVAAKKGAGAAEILTAKVGGGGKGFLGLKPYEIQNLSYQVNDVVTSLASGISPTQTLAQQGGQIAQIFPGILQTLIKFLPVIAAVSAAVGLLVYNLAETKKQADAIRSFTAEFASFGNAAGYSAKQFADAQIALERVGVSADAARQALRTFIDAGLNPAGLDSFLTTVRGIAAATGEDVPTAAKQFSDALTKGYDSVASLNDITHTLTDAQLTQVKGLYDAGKAQEARTLVDEIYRQKAQGIADASRSDWSRATERLGDAFRSLANTFEVATVSGGLFGRFVDKTLIPILNRFRDAANDTKSVLAALYDFKAKGEARFNSIGQDAAGAAKALKDARAKYGLGDDGNFAQTAAPKPATGSAVRSASRRTAAGQAFIDDQQTQLRNAKVLTQAERLLNAERDAGNKAAAASLSQADVVQARLNGRKIEQKKIDAENATAAKSAQSAANKAQREAEAAARKAEERQRKIDQLTKDLENTFTSLGSNRKDDPFKAIQDNAQIAIRDITAKFAELGKLGLKTVDGKTLADYEAAVKAQAALLTQQAQQRKNEEDVNRLLDERKQKLAEIEDQVAANTLTPAQANAAAKGVVDDLNPQIKTAADSAAAFATSLRTAHLDPKLEASIARFSKVATEAGGNATLIQVDLGNLKTAQTGLDALVNKRDALVQVQKILEKTGNESSVDAERNIKKIFDDSRPAIVASAEAVDNLISQILAVPGLPPEVVASLEAARAKTLETVAATNHLTDEQIALRGAAVRALADGIGTFIESLGDTIADVIDGTSSLSGALASIGNAALSFAANFTKAIAQAIIQLVALRIAKAALNGIFGVGSFHSGGVVGSGTAPSRREVSPLAFLGAVRYHTGGLVGLRPDETPAILQQGEEVITAQDKRHRNNGGLAGAAPAAPVIVKNINLFDAGEAVSQGANTAVGEQSIINVLSRNPGAAKAALGID